MRNTSKKNFAILGSTKEFERVQLLLSQTQNNLGETDHFESVESLQNAEKTYDEILFCSADLSFESIIETMGQFKSNAIDFKIAPKESTHLIGSNSIDTAGELYILNLNALVSSENKRKKRLFDILGAFALVLGTPIAIFLFENKTKFMRNIVRVLIGKYSFIGFSEDVSLRDVRLPRIKKGLLTPDDGFEFSDEGITEKLNLLYARDYSMRKDFSILWKAWKKLDR